MSDWGDDSTKPLLLGYIRRDLLTIEAQVHQLERAFEKYAQAEGYSMGFTFVEKPGNAPAAFERLIAEMLSPVLPARAVIVPSLFHFAVLDATRTDMRATFEKATGGRVVVLPT